MNRLNAAGLLRLAGELSGPQREVLQLVARLRLVSHAQLAALLTPTDASASAASTARTVRRTLAQLTARGVLARLERRIGGVRAGSAGYVYYVGPVGQRLLAYWQGSGVTRGRFRPEPGGRYVRHRLSVSALYVELRLADRAGQLDLLTFDAEPDCWRRALDGFGGSLVLKPDVFVRVGVGAYEERCFIEVDLGTESRTVIASKLRAYLDYLHTGVEQATSGVFPRVLLLTNTANRRAALEELIERQPAEYQRVFTVAMLDEAVAAIGGAATVASAEADDDGGWS